MSQQAPPPSHPKVLVYRSAITDIRTVEARLRRAELPFEVEVVGMASQDERKRYRELKQSSGRGTLPLIFIDDKCIGGEPELARYIAERRDREPASPEATDKVDASIVQATEPLEVPAPADDAPRTLEAPAPATTSREAHSDDTQVPPVETDIPPELTAQTRESDSRAIQQRTARLGYAGLIPFLACAVGSFFGPQQELARLALVAYGAVIFSFVGAVHWGFALGRQEESPRGLGASVLPSLLAWLALALQWRLGEVASLGLLGVSFLLWHVFERLSKRLPAHYLSLRLRLTSAVVTILLAACSGHLLGLGGA